MASDTSSPSIMVRNSGGLPENGWSATPRPFRAPAWSVAEMPRRRHASVTAPVHCPVSRNVNPAAPRPLWRSNSYLIGRPSMAMIIGFLNSDLAVRIKFRTNLLQNTRFQGMGKNCEKNRHGGAKYPHINPTSPSDQQDAAVQSMVRDWCSHLLPAGAPFVHVSDPHCLRPEVPPAPWPRQVWPSNVNCRPAATLQAPQRSGRRCAALAGIQRSGGDRTNETFVTPPLTLERAHFAMSRLWLAFNRESSWVALVII